MKRKCRSTWGPMLAVLCIAVFASGHYRFEIFAGTWHAFFQPARHALLDSRSVMALIHPYS
jgi:hypothetical protein